MSSSLVTHKSIHPLSSSIWGRDSKRFSHEAKLGGWPHLRSRGAGVATAYLEPEPNPVSQFFKNVQGSLPIVGLLSRLLNDEGGIGNDRIQPVEFAARVQKNCSYKASQAFYEFQERHGPVAKSQYVLLWCWAAAVGAGLLKSDDLIMSAARLRCSNDVHYETENLELLMDDAKKRREKSKSPAMNVPIEARAEKALDAIMKCCVGASYLDEEDVPLLITILTTVFPSADASEIDRMVTSRLAYSDDDEASAEEDNEEDRTEGFVVEDMANSVTQ